MPVLKDEISAMIAASESEDEPSLSATLMNQSDEEGESHGQELQGEQAEEGSEGQQGSEVAPPGEEAELTPEQRYNQLLEAYNAQSAQLLDLQTRGVAPPPSTLSLPAAQAPQVSMPPPSSAPAFQINKELLTRALIEDDPDAMSEILNGMLEHLAKNVPSIDHLRESVLLDLPRVARDVARSELVMLKAVDEFYSTNQDLRPYMGAVGAITNEIAAKDPQLPLGEILQKVEVEARRRLGLKKQAVSNSNSRPAFASKPGSRKPGAPKITGVISEIAAIEAANRR